MLFQSGTYATYFTGHSPCGELQTLLSPLENADTDLDARIETGKSYLKLPFLKGWV